MLKITKTSKNISLFYFWIGIIATFGYRVIIVLNFYDPVWVKVAWYVGTIGFIFYFWSRYQLVQQFTSLIKGQKLVNAVEKAKNISDDQKEALSFIVGNLEKTKAQINYIFIFILSAIALVAGIVLDFLT
ncbi:MAG: hypothetical protein ABH846_04545 [Patescibacteria group bacterium]